MAKTNFELGLHGESPNGEGPVDVGLVIDGDDALGVELEVPKLGRLTIALALLDDGAQLINLQRNGQPVAIDETKALRLEAELQKLKAARSDTDASYQDRLAALETARDEARDRAAALKDELMTLQAMMDEDGRRFTEERQALADEIHHANAALQVEKDERFKLLADRERARSEISVLGDAKSRAEQLESDLVTLKAATNEADAKVRELESQLASLTADAEIARSQASEAAQRADTLEAELGVARASHQDAGARAQSLETDLTDATAARAEAEERLQRLERELESTRGQSTDAGERLQALESELSQARATTAAAESKLSELEANASELETKQTATETELFSARADAAEAAAKISSLETELQQAKSRAVTLETNLTQTTAADATELSLAKARLEAVEAERDALLQTQTNHAEAEARASSEREELEQRAQRLETELQAAVGAQSDVVARAEARADALQSERDELVYRVEQLTSDLSAAGARAAELSMQSTAVSDVENRATLLLEERDQARNLARQMQSQSKGLLAERDEARAVARALHSRLAGETEQLKKEIAKLHLQNEQLSRQVDAERHARARVTHERDAIREQVVTATPATQMLPAVADPTKLTTSPYELRNLRKTQPEMPIHDDVTVEPLPDEEWSEEITATGVPAVPAPEGQQTVMMRKPPRKP